MIRFQVIDVMMPELDYDRVRAWIEAVVASEGYQIGELYYYFCSDEALLDLNRRRLGHDFYTDIVTFPLAEESLISSEFCLSLDRIAENSLNFGRSLESELLRVIIHGVLHLIGYDDHTDSEQAEMRSKEEECLESFYNNLNINKL